VQTVSKLELARYSLFAAPLAMAALPIYVHVPKLYAELGLSLSSLGVLLLVLRFADALVDPLLGRWSDRLATRYSAIAIASVVLLLGMLGLHEIALVVRARHSGLPSSRFRTRG